MDPFQYLLTLEKFGIKFGLSNIRTLCTALGEPQTKYRSLLIAGTNGKGSVAAMVDCALRAAGLTVGRYTSPHLVHLEERFVINGRPVDSGTLAHAIEEVRTLIQNLVARGRLEASPTFFEVTTAIAFELFGRAGVQWAVLEVGLGGRLDSTNIVDPIAAAITSIAFDHEQYLGKTLTAIATEKAGIIRTGRPVILGRLDPEARSAIVKIADLAGARVIDAHEGVELESKTVDGRTSITLKTDRADYGSILLSLRGEHQISNALVAVRLLEQLEREAPLGKDAIIAGLRDVRWPGRLQLVERPDHKRVLLDAAHNPAGASVLAAYLTREFRERLPLVFGAMRDKDAAEMLRVLLPAVSTIIVTEPRNNRTRPAEELAGVIRALEPGRTVHIEPVPIAALERAWKDHPLACAAGSIFLVGDLLEGLGTGVKDL